MLTRQRSLVAAHKTDGDKPASPGRAVIPVAAEIVGSDETSGRSSAHRCPFAVIAMRSSRRVLATPPTRPAAAQRGFSCPIRVDHAGSVCPVVDRKVRARFRDGDPEAVRIVYRTYGRLVYAVARKVLGDRTLAEEATQQAFLNAWRAAGSLDESREIGPWLATIARRVAIDVYRREAHRAAAALESVPAGDPSLVSQPQSAEAVFDAWEVRRAVAALPADEREIVRLQHFEGLTHAQIGPSA